MNLGKLSKRLRKELLANPKQAAVLAIVCLVACWFWSPLLMKWFQGKPEAPVAKAEPAAAAESANTKTESQRPWFDIHRWRQDDPLTRSAMLAVNARDPFRRPKPTTPPTEQPQPGETEQARIVSVAPRTVNLTLEAIVFSGSRRLAQINGQTVREGEAVAIGDSSEQDEDVSTQLTGKVTAIAPAEVLLDVGGRAVRLSLQPKLLGRGEMVQRLKTK